MTIPPDGPSLLRTFGFAIRRGWRRVTGKSNRYVRGIYKEKDYLDAYAEHTDIRVRRDPHAAIGGYWYTGGKFQFELLQRHGLRPHHRMLDIGCGTLRVGRLVARYLEPGHYTGLDISRGALDYANKLVAKEGLTERKPRLVLNEHKRLTFDQFPDETFDYLMAYSVFTHLPRESVDECFAHVGNVMHDDSIFFFTFNEADEYGEPAIKQFSYPFSEFEAMAERHGLDLERGADVRRGFEQEDPDLQVLVKATKR